MSVEDRLAELGLTLPPPPPAAGNYLPFVREGNLLLIAGQVPRDASGGLAHIGRLGQDYTVEQGQEAARSCVLQGLAAAKAALGDLAHIKQVLRVGGFVNCTPDFTQQPQVINGASDLLVELLGEKGQHARAAVGCSALPGGVAVEVEFMLSVT